jgi:hypothetical protein
MPKSVSFISRHARRHNATLRFLRQQIRPTLITRKDQRGSEFLGVSAVQAESLLKSPKGQKNTLDALANPKMKQPTYTAPGLDIIHYPQHPNMFDGFVISGRAWGSELRDTKVKVTIGGVTRQAVIREGLWATVFEDGALPIHHPGRKEVKARLTDALGHSASDKVDIQFEVFVDSYISIDTDYLHSTIAGRRHLIATGELNLGTHLVEREMIVTLVRDDSEGCIVSVGNVVNGWHHGEWRAKIPVPSNPQGSYRVRAQLMDGASPALTRTMTGLPVTFD